MQNVNGKLRQLSSNKENRANSTWLAIYLKKTGGDSMSKKKVCIDAGHGGNEPGAVGPNGTKEKDVTLQIALLARDALQRCGIEVVMTRNSDIKSGRLVIAERCKIANDAKVDYLISILANADGDRSDKTIWYGNMGI